MQIVYIPVASASGDEIFEEFPKNELPRGKKVYDMKLFALGIKVWFTPSSQQASSETNPTDL